jgi:hypothetical protein
VLIIGNKGAGKSTFIDRFFRLVLDKRLRDNCLILRIDLADSNGSTEGIASWLTDRLKNQLEAALFKGVHPTYEQLQGVFMGEYDRWRYGERKYLYERDRNEFKEKFVIGLQRLSRSSRADTSKHYSTIPYSLVAHV